MEKMPETKLSFGALEEQARRLKKEITFSDKVEDTISALVEYKSYCKINGLDSEISSDEEANLIYEIGKKAAMNMSKEESVEKLNAETDLQ